MSSSENKTMESNNDVKSSQTDDIAKSPKLPRSETEASLRRTGVLSEDVRFDRSSRTRRFKKNFDSFISLLNRFSRKCGKI